jgi:hypothetical protein
MVARLWENTIYVEEVCKMIEVGTRIRIVSPVVVYNHPEHRSKPFDMNGHEGDVIGLATEYQGRSIISANFPYIVKFGPKHKLHLCDSEIAVVDA